MKYHSLFPSKIRKDVEKLSSAAVMIGALRVKSYVLLDCSGGITGRNECLTFILGIMLASNCFWMRVSVSLHIRGATVATSFGYNLHVCVCMP